MAYIFMSIISIINAYVMRNIRIVYSKINLKVLKAILYSIPFVIVSGNRAASVGTDYRAYAIAYYELGNLSRGREFEILGTYVIKIANAFNSPLFIIWFYTITICVGMMYFILNNSHNVIFSIFLFYITGYFNWSLNIMRQTLATVIVFIFLQALFNSFSIKNRLIFLVGIFIAALFHKTALLYLIFAFFPYNLFRKKFKYFMLILPILPFLSYSIREVMIIVSQKINFYYKYFNNFYDQQTYTGSLIFASIVCMLPILLTYKEWKDQQNQKLIVLAFFQYISLVFSLIANIIPNNSRITFLFYPIAIIAIPEFMTLMTKSIKRIVFTIIVVLLVLFYWNSFYVGNWGETFPFKWYDGRII